MSPVMTDYELDTNPQNVVFDRPDCSLPSILDYSDGTSTHMIPHPVLITMALTEAARKRGRGKFYWNVSGSIKDYDDSFRDKGNNTVHMVFRNEVWGDHDLMIWNSLTLRAKFEFLQSDARLGIDDIVLPVHVHVPYQGKAPGTIEFDQPATDLDHIALMYSPRPRVFMSDQLRPLTSLEGPNNKRLVIFNVQNHAAAYEAAKTNNHDEVVEYATRAWDNDNGSLVVRYRDVVMEQYQGVGKTDEFITNVLPGTLGRQR